MRTAQTFWQRIKGRLGENTPSTPLYIPRCASVHTIGMKFPLHLTWFGENEKILKQEVVPPGRLAFCPGAKAVLESHLKELPADESGQALVEAAFTIPVLLIIIFGFIQIGLAVHQAQKLTYVTHYATQVGAITNDPNKISGAIEEFLDVSEFSLFLESRDNNGSVIADNDRQHNDILTIRVEQPFTLQIPLVSISAIDLSAQASARILCTNTVSPYICNS